MITPRKIYTFRETTLTEEEQTLVEPLVKAAVVVVLPNPYAGRAYSEDLSDIVDSGPDIARLLAETARDLLNKPIQSYGKASLVGGDGALEHGVAGKIGEFGHVIREITGGDTWLPSVVKRVAPGATVDIPLASVTDIWVRSHYDAVTITVPDGPWPGEFAVAFAVASGGRPHPRLGGMTLDEALAKKSGAQA